MVMKTQLVEFSTQTQLGEVSGLLYSRADKTSRIGEMRGVSDVTQTQLVVFPGPPYEVNL
jgi:hypothetical protein